MERGVVAQSDRLHGAALGVVAVLVLAFLWFSPAVPPVWAGVGRLHPAVVHFPIAFLTLAAVLDLWGSLRSQVQVAARMLWLAGLWSLIPALLAGHMLAQSGSWELVLLDRHRWAAVGLLAVGVAGFLLRAGRPSVFGRRLTAVPVLLLVAWTGHGGGSLTHGPDYFTAWWREGEPGSRQQELGPLPVFAGIIQPILSAECVSCHGPARAEGGLRLDSYEALRKGGDEGPVLAAGRPEASELYRRVTLPPGHRERMPPADRPPLGVGETELLAWWISLGASPEMRVAEVRPDQMPTSVRTALLRRGRLGPADPLANLDPVDPLPTGTLESLAGQGIPVRLVARDCPYLEVDLSGRLVTAGELDRLAAVEKHVAWLDLSGCRLEPDAWERLGRFVNLQRLRLDRSNVTSPDLAALAGLNKLSYLNLYGTAVADDGLRHLESLSGLSTVYVWQTGVTDSGIRELAARLPRLRVEAGVSSPEAPASAEGGT